MQTYETKTAIFARNSTCSLPLTPPTLCEVLCETGLCQRLPYAICMLHVDCTILQPGSPFCLSRSKTQQKKYPRSRKIKKETNHGRMICAKNLHHLQCGASNLTQRQSSHCESFWSTCFASKKTGKNTHKN